MSIRPMPNSVPRNGLDWGGYVYRGTGEDTLTPHLTVARDPDRAPGRPRKDGRCGSCGYALIAAGHRNTCGSNAPGTRGG